ncbi:aldehyde dehydrogenase family protein [Phaeovulum sp. W22_SRMD_FR3]|uniref:aldehyde dehydrogenase family protein n=1 Tax=Phaeovulum sp. W22_SRMD_FR3 TaxID=3240274 RepID=UPI003F9656DC
MTPAHADDFFIDGRWQPAAQPGFLTVINPATETPIGQIAAGTPAEVDAAVAAARRAFPGFAQTTTQARADLLGRIHALILARAEEFARAIATEMGCAITFARNAQVPFAAEHLRVQAEGVLRYPFLSHQGTTAIAREAIGVAALITPWNWPLYQITAKVAPALAAGCTVVLKPSELSPYSALLFAQVVADAGAPAGVFNMIGGTGPVVGAALAAHPEVDAISITGSTGAGAAVARGAAAGVKRVVQELGGKSPNVLLEDADFGVAVEKGLLAGMRNVGQSCSAPTRMLVPRARLREVEGLAARAAAAIRLGDPQDAATDMGPIANQAQWERVQKMISTGIAEGATLIAGGMGRPEGLERGYFARPTVFSNVATGMQIAQQEIFGPVLVILPYDDEDHAAEIANDTIYGLGAHVQSANADRARRFAMRIRAGQVHLNNPAWDPEAPFGGYKQSGNGREYGRFGLEEFLETKAIIGYGAP